MLQGMERHAGLFICTTNLLDRIDEAALRRFTFKIKFSPLRLEQRTQLFVQEACAGDLSRLDTAVQRALTQMDQLCLGDFAAVKRQLEILGGDLTPTEFLEQLLAEHRIKPDVRERRFMGFMP
jgi:SpoVK/Ycf46/Vps4 family AAA+-type ATPase